MGSDDFPTQRGGPDDEMTRRELVDGASVFGRYRLEAVAGRGGMGVVWKAYDEELQRTVALKVLPDEVASDPEAMEELRRETRRCLELTHPNIVRVHDFVHDHRRAAIAMEFVEGETLARRRASAPSGCLGVAELAPLVRQLCAALDYAHGKARVVHRDLKPANLLVTPAGELKISDFGVARSLAEAHTRLTGRSPGSTSGTLPYMSPQQVSGRKPAVTDDIYSLGATLYALLTSRPPFHRGEAASVIAQIRENAPLPLAEQRTELEVTGAPVPREWEETILACLAKEEEKRPQSAGEVARRLGIAAPGSETADVRTGALPPPPVAVAAAPPHPAAATGTAAPGARRSRGRGVWLAGAAAGLIAVALAGYYVTTGRGRSSDAQSRHTPEETGEPGSQTQGQTGNLTQPQAGRAWAIPDLALRLAYLRPGTFVMGSPGSEPDRYDDEGPQTRVKFTRGFWLAKTEVTQAQWEALMGNNPASFKGADRPVEQVSWTEAMEFCRKLTDKERSAGRLPSGFVYALPTEAQWEYACRAGDAGPYAEGGSLDDRAWYSRNSGKTTHPVAQKSMNAWGLYDMHGNVREWCRDWYGAYPGGTVSDPEGPESGTLRVNRGGNWNEGARFCRSADRGSLKPGARFNYLGFRVALAPAP